MVSATHLVYDTRIAGDFTEGRHPQVVMRELGITYQLATPQSMADQWWFWNCLGVTADLPKYLKPLDMDPHKCVGWGLSQAQADRVSEGGPT